MRARLDDPAWLDAQYDNRARVADYPQLRERWAAASALARSRSKAQLDLRYAEGEGATLDLFQPTDFGGAPAPVLVYIHGGYFRCNDKADQSFVAPALNAAGAIVVLPNYALCPAVGVEHIALQMTQAVAWVWRNAARYGGDPRRIALAGHSAGGLLATLLLSCRWKEVADDLPPQPVGGALSISGFYDLEPLRHAPFVQRELRLTPASVARLSPAFFPRPKGARLYAVVGLDESDEFLRQAHLIRDVWGPTAVPVCETIPRADHFTMLQQLADPGSRVHELALRLLGLR